MKGCSPKTPYVQLRQEVPPPFFVADKWQSRSSFAVLPLVDPLAPYVQPGPWLFHAEVFMETGRIGDGLMEPWNNQTTFMLICFIEVEDNLFFYLFQIEATQFKPHIFSDDSWLKSSKTHLAFGNCLFFPSLLPWHDLYNFPLAFNSSGTLEGMWRFRQPRRPAWSSSRWKIGACRPRWKEQLNPRSLPTLSTVGVGGAKSRLVGFPAKIRGFLVGVGCPHQITAAFFFTAKPGPGFFFRAGGGKQIHWECQIEI